MGKLIYTDGAKSMTIQDSWDFVDTQAASQTKDGELYSRVAAAFQAVNITAKAVANMPFVILNKQGEIYDDSTAWKNRVGFMPNPRDTIRRICHSMIMTNMGYLRMGKNAAGIKKKLNYTVPTSIEIITDPVTGELVKLNRIVNGAVIQTFAPDDPDLIRFWWLDEKTELLPSPDTEFKAIMSAAGILFYSDFFTENFYKRGGVKPTLIAMKGMVMGDKKEEMQKDWTSWVRGIGKFASNITAKIFNAETMDIKPFGEGLGDLKDTPVYRQALENIAIGLNMPLSRLLSNSANRATADTEYIQWFRDSITPRFDFIADALNDQVLTKMNLRMVSTPENTDPEQDDETKGRVLNSLADALGKYPDADTFLGAADSIGVELNDDFIEAVKRHYAKKEAKPEPVEVQPVTPEPPTVDDTITDTIPTKWIPSLDELEEMRVWREVATRKLKKGEGMKFAYEPHYGGLPVYVAETISASLVTATTADEIKAAFNTATINKTDAPPPQDDTALKALAESINAAVSLLTVPEVKAEPVQPVYNFTMPAITLNTQMPEQGSITVNVPEQQTVINIPEQPAPVVNITNNVEPTPVTIKNDIKVPAAKEDKKRKAIVKRDMSGNITEIVSE